MKKAKQAAKNTSSPEKRPELIDFSERLRVVIEHLKIEKKNFAQAGGITAQSLSGYLAAIREPGASSLAGWIHTYNLDINWLLTGQGEMIRSPSPSSVQVEPLPEKVRIMREYVSMMKELHATDEDIKKGLNAYMGVSENKDKSTYGNTEPPSSSGPSRIHEGQGEFGKKDY
ncbi:MAG: helix-turn-helix domain-containing protein [Solidesulfovibrio sp. DCME]|uniref:helix-turn-helix domain-containing protein n=1 Tax=Solidesulfovibrio sp. DCME TaxID=3447380 RepID=UPI003D0B5A33